MTDAISSDSSSDVVEVKYAAQVPEEDAVSEAAVVVDQSHTVTQKGEASVTVGSADSDTPGEETRKGIDADLDALEAGLPQPTKGAKPQKKDGPALMIAIFFFIALCLGGYWMYTVQEQQVQEALLKKQQLIRQQQEREAEVQRLQKLQEEEEEKFRTCCLKQKEAEKKQKEAEKQRKAEEAAAAAKELAEKKAREAKRIVAQMAQANKPDSDEEVPMIKEPKYPKVAKGALVTSLMANVAFLICMFTQDEAAADAARQAAHDAGEQAELTGHQIAMIVIGAIWILSCLTGCICMCLTTERKMTAAEMAQQR